MNINKALSHFKWRFETSFKDKNKPNPTENDIQAFNAILAYKELQESKSLSENELLAKLWIHQLILLARTNMYNGERCVQVIDEILSKPVYEWCLILKDEIPLMRFNAIGVHKYQLEKENVLNRTKLSEINEKIINEFETDLTKALKSEISEENIIKFVSQNVNRIIDKFDK